MGIFSLESTKSFWKSKRGKIKVDSRLGVPASGVNIVTTATTTTTNIVSLTEQTSASSSSASGLPQPPSESTEAKGKSKQAKKAESKPALGLKKLKDPTDTTQVDIVAIHGLNGHREKSFTAENGVCWLTDLLPAEIPTARIFSYGYDARTHDSSPLSTVHLLGHAQQLVEVLTRTRRSTKSTRRPIIFVAHSLGGIILKSALSLSYSTNENHLEDQKDIALSTYGILFMGTPHQGTQEASWGKLVVNLVSIAKNTKTEYIDHLKSDSEWLENQNMHYNAISDQFDTKYFYEEYPTKFLGGEILVVPRSSACMPGATNVAYILIHSDHRGMVIFEDSDDDGFVAVYQSILIMLEAAAEKIGANWNKWESIKGS